MWNLLYFFININNAFNFLPKMEFEIFLPKEQKVVPHQDAEHQLGITHIIFDQT